MADIKSLIRRGKAALTGDRLQAALERAQAVCTADLEAATDQADTARREIADLERRAAVLREQHQRLTERVGRVVASAEPGDALARRDTAKAEYAAAVATGDPGAEARAGAALRAAEQDLSEQRTLRQGDDQQRQALQEAAIERRQLLDTIEQSLAAHRSALAKAEAEAAMAQHDTAVNAFIAATLPLMRTLPPAQVQALGTRLAYFTGSHCLFEGLGLGLPDGPNTRVYDIMVARRLMDALLPAEQEQRAA
jgi:hypothetical protein